MGNYIAPPKGADITRQAMAAELLDAVTGYLAGKIGRLAAGGQHPGFLHAYSFSACGQA